MFSSRPLIHELETIRKCRSQINCVTPAILLRELFSSPRLDRDKNVTRIWKQVSGKFWSQNKEWRNYAQIRAETTARCSKIRDLRQTRNKRSHKSYLKHKLEILRSNNNIFLDSFRQSVIPCRKKLISARCWLASTHIEAIIDGEVGYFLLYISLYI